MVVVVLEVVVVVVVVVVAVQVWCGGMVGVVVVVEHQYG